MRGGPVVGEVACESDEPPQRGAGPVRSVGCRPSRLRRRRVVPLCRDAVALSSHAGSFGVNCRPLRAQGRLLLADPLLGGGDLAGEDGLGMGASGSPKRASASARAAVSSCPLRCRDQSGMPTRPVA